MERISTGIPVLDEMISGGYPLNRTMLLTGNTGAGKTIVGLHFIHQSCVDGKKCSMIATEENPGDMMDQAASLGIPLLKYYKQGSLVIDKIYDERTEYM